MSILVGRSVGCALGSRRRPGSGSAGARSGRSGLSGHGARCCGREAGGRGGGNHSGDGHGHVARPARANRAGAGRGERDHHRPERLQAHHVQRHEIFPLSGEAGAGSLSGVESRGMAGPDVVRGRRGGGTPGAVGIAHQIAGATGGSGGQAQPRPRCPVPDPRHSGHPRRRGGLIHRAATNHGDAVTIRRAAERAAAVSGFRAVFRDAGAGLPLHRADHAGELQWT